MACIKAFLHFGLTPMLWIYLLCPLVSCAIFLEAGPRNKTVVDGDKVSLICDLNNDNYNTIYWTYLIRPGSRRYISSNEYIYPSTGFGVDPDNYEVIIDQSQQTYKLVIFAINLATEGGIYDCGYEQGTSKRYTPLASAMITVTPFPESVSCHQFMLSSLGSGVNKEFEVACSWTHSQPGEAHFDSSSGETTDVDLRFPGRIISRIESQDTPSIICRFMLDSDASSTVNAPCFGDDTPGLVRVDPFISEVTIGSNASFVCTSGNQNYSPEISWKLNVNGSDPLDSQDRLIENNDVFSIVNVQEDDQDMLVECQVHISEDLVVSSYASLRIVEVITTPSRRPPGESQSNQTTDRTTTQNSIIEVTRPLPANTRRNIVIPLTVIILVIIFAIIISFIISVLCNKRKINRNMNFKVKRVRTNLSEESPSDILNVIQTRDPNRGEHSRTEAQRSGELSLVTSPDSHQYSSKIYRSDNRSCSTVLESDLDLEPNCDRQTRQGSCQMETNFMDVNQKATHLEVQSFEHYYETMRDEEKPKKCAHNRLMTSLRPDEKEQELKDTVAEQKTSNSSSRVAQWKVDPGDLHSRPLPRCPKNPITVQYLYDHLPSAEDITKDEIHSYGEINKMPSSTHIASQGFGIENKSKCSTGTSSEAKGDAIKTTFTEDVLNDENIDCSGMIRTSLRSSRKGAMVNSEQCDEMYLKMKAKSDDPSHLDNSYLQDIQSPVFNLTPMCRQDP